MSQFHSRTWRDSQAVEQMSYLINSNLSDTLSMTRRDIHYWKTRTKALWWWFDFLTASLRRTERQQHQIWRQSREERRRSINYRINQLNCSHFDIYSPPPPHPNSSRNFRNPSRQSSSGESSTARVKSKYHPASRNPLHSSPSLSEAAQIDILSSLSE